MSTSLVLILLAAAGGMPVSHGQPAIAPLVTDGEVVASHTYVAGEVEYYMTEEEKDYIRPGLTTEIVSIELPADRNIFLIPSQSESFGLAALEAMSCGKPVVSSSVGGLPELIKHNETGFIAEIGDVDRMAKYVVDLLTNDKKYEAFSKSSRDRALNKFD